MESEWTSRIVGRIIYGTMMAVLGFVSFFGYFTFLRAIWNRQSLQRKTIVLMSLCVSDLCIVFGHMIAMIIGSFFVDWPWGELGCQVNAFFGMGLSFVSIGNIALHAYDTYLKETKSDLHGMNYGFYITAVWVLGLFSGFLPCIGIGSYGFESDLHVACLIDYTKSQSGNLTFVGIISVIWFVIPMFIIFKYYWRLREETGNGILLTLIPCQMLWSWMPYAVTSILTLTFGADRVPLAAFGVISSLFAKICLTSNPFIYVANDLELRLAWCNVWLGKPKKKKPNTVSFAVDFNASSLKEKSS